MDDLGDMDLGVLIPDPDDNNADNMIDLDIFDTAGVWDTDVNPQGSPGEENRDPMSRAQSPNHAAGGSGSGSGPGDEFRYGQEEQGASLESLLQQPLALGYLVSTASAGPMPRWFWSSCPHLESVCPVFLKSALHLNQASVHQSSDDGFSGGSSSAAAGGRVHSLDSGYTTDVLR